MSDRPTLYRINPDTSWDYAIYIETGVLVKVERCQHGRIDPHIETSHGGSMTYHCPGSPTLEADDE